MAGVLWLASPRQVWAGSSTNGGPAVDAGAVTTIPRADTGWVSTWAGSPSSPDTNFTFAGSAYHGNNNFSNQTMRLIVHASLGGKRVRINLSNELGTAPLRVGAAHLALSGGAANILDGTDRTLTFNGGQDSVTIPPGATILSDPVKLGVPALANLAVTLFLPDTVTVLTAVPGSQQTNYVAPAGSGDATGVPTLPLDATAPAISQWPILTRVDVRSVGSRAFVALGSSITLAVLTTTDANARWTDVLAKRLHNQGLSVSVVNAGIIANRLFSNGNGLGGLARLKRDVLAQPGIGYVFINDILGVESQSAANTPEAIIAGLRQVITQAHSVNAKAFAGTIIPLRGSANYSAAFEVNRQGVNEFIRHGGELDGYVDFDAAVGDPADPTIILPAYDGGDHHHPNDLGNQRMAQAFDLALFQ